MGKTRAECSQNAYTSAFLGHWIQILANSSPKSDIFNNNNNKTKKTWPCFFAFYGRSGEGNITIFLGPYDDNSCDDYYAILITMGITLKMYKPQVYCDWW